jgi:putative chitinase
MVKTMSDWLSILQKIAPKGRPDILSGVAASMPDIIATYELSTPNRISRFLGQWGEETDGYRTLEEYASGAAYEGRKDLGNTRRGDGKRYKGRGLAMLTGRANYQKVGKQIGVDLEADPTVATQFPTAVATAGTYWANHNLNELADAKDDRGLTRRINGGLNGFTDRIEYTKRAEAALAGVDHDPHPHYDPDDWPRSKLASLQARLTELGYAAGKPDGRMGTGTASAITAFQHDHQLPITGVPDAETATAIWAAADPRPIPDERAKGLPQESTILKNTQGALAAGSIAIGSISAPDLSNIATQASQVLTEGEQVKSYWTRITNLLGVFGTELNTWALAHPLHIVALVAFAILFWKVWTVRKQRILDFRNWKTS